MLNLDGVFVPHITPFGVDGEIDLLALRRLVWFWLNNGCSGLVTCGSNGESAYLSRADRMMVIKTVVDEVAGKAPVIAGVGAPSTRETLIFANDAEKGGVDGLIVVAPYYFKPDDKELVEHFKAVVESTSLPILIYNVPKFTGYNLEPALVEQIATNCSRMAGIKDSCGSVQQLSRLVSRVGDRVAVMAGTGDLIFPGLCVGCRGAIVAVANVAPHLCGEIYDEFQRGNFEGARELQHRTLALNGVLVGRYNQISSIKLALNLLGEPAGYPRRPSLPLDDKAQADIAAMLKRTLGHMGR